MATVAGAWDELLEGEELAYTTEVPARDADVVGVPESLNPSVQAALAARGLTGLYRHQAEAFEAAAQHVGVAEEPRRAELRSLVARAGDRRQHVVGCGEVRVRAEGELEDAVADGGVRDPDPAHARILADPGA
jgi:hypothetical protein